MRFIALNGKKIRLRLLINLCGNSLIALVIYWLMVRAGEADAVWLVLALVYGFGLLWFLIFLFAGWYQLRISGRLLAQVSRMPFFEGNECFRGYLEEDSRIFYTKECLCGMIEGYPVIISFELATTDGETSKLNFEAVTIKFKRPNLERMAVRVNWLRGYEPKRDVREEVRRFIKDLKQKQAVPGCFDDVVAGKYLTILTGGDALVEGVR